MKAHKIDLTDYSTDQLNEKGEPMPVKVVTSLVNLLFHPGMKLGGMALLEQQKLADKLLAKGEFVLLDAKDYQKLRQAMENFRGFTQMHVELVRRVLDAPEVEVEEATSPTKKE